MLRLLGKASSINVRKVLWTCAELGLACQREDWGSGFRPTSDPAFRDLNPHGLVPVLVDGDAVLWESNTICRYLAGREGRTDLLPATPVGRAAVERWMDWQGAELNPSWRAAFMALVRGSRDFSPEAVADSVRNWSRQMTVLDGWLQGSGGHVVGPGFTLADVVVGLSTHRWFATPIERPALPAVEAYYEKLSEREAFRVHGRNGLP